MFDRLAASLNFALQLFSALDLDQIFSTKFLRYEQIFDRLAISSSGTRGSGKEQPIENNDGRSSVDLVGQYLAKMFIHLATECRLY